MKKIVQLVLTEKEYNKLSEEAKKKGVTVPFYIKSKVLDGYDLEIYMKQLLKKVDNLPKGVKFNIKTLFGIDWNMDRGIKLALGRHFYKMVESNMVKNVKIDKKDSSNIMWYEKL